MDVTGPIEHCVYCDAPVITDDTDNAVCDEEYQDWYHRSCWENSEDSKAEKAAEREFTAYWEGSGSTFADTLREAQQQRDYLK